MPAQIPLAPRAPPHANAPLGVLPLPAGGDEGEGEGGSSGSSTLHDPHSLHVMASSARPAKTIAAAAANAAAAAAAAAGSDGNATIMPTTAIPSETITPSPQTTVVMFDATNAVAERGRLAKQQSQAAAKRLRRKRREKEKAAASDAAAKEADAAAARPTVEELAAFNEKTAGRVVAHARAIRQAGIKEKLAKRKDASKYADFDTKAFRRETHARVQERTVRN